MWDCGFNSSDGPEYFNSQCADDELDIIELGYGIMFGMVAENDYDSDFALDLIRMRASIALHRM